MSPRHQSLTYAPELNAICPKTGQSRNFFTRWWHQNAGSGVITKVGMVHTDTPCCTAKCKDYGHGTPQAVASGCDRDGIVVGWCCG